MRRLFRSSCQFGIVPMCAHTKGGDNYRYAALKLFRPLGEVMERTISLEVILLAVLLPTGALGQLWHSWKLVRIATQQGASVNFISYAPIGGLVAAAFGIAALVDSRVNILASWLALVAMLAWWILALSVALRASMTAGRSRGAKG